MTNHNRSSFIIINYHYWTYVSPIVRYCNRFWATRMQLLPGISRKSSLHLPYGVPRYVCQDAVSTLESFYPNGCEF